MNTFLTLYKFELRKILQKRSVKITAAFAMILTCALYFFSLLGGVYVNDTRIGSKYKVTMEDIASAKEYDGQPASKELLQKMADAYSNLSKSKTSDEYIENHRITRRYKYLHNFVMQAMGITNDMIYNGWEVNIEEMYDFRRDLLENEWEQLRLTESEKEFWREKENQIEKPAIFRVYNAYRKMFAYIMSLGVVTLIVITVSLSGVFCDEHARRTDQLIFVSAKGKTTLYGAKLLAGVTFGAGLAAVLSLLSMITAFSIYGTDGYNAAFQFIYGRCSLPISCLQGVLISYASFIAASAFFSLFIMLAAELTRTAAGGLIIGTALIVASGMINLPDRFRVPVQILNALPTAHIFPSSIFSPLTYPFFGARILPAIAVPVIYLIVGIIIWIAGKKLYSGFQVSGR